jgi:hypothetical protein
MKNKIKETMRSKKRISRKKKRIYGVTVEHSCDVLGHTLLLVGLPITHCWFAAALKTPINWKKE